MTIHTWCGPSANLGCRSETCCTWLAGNAGPKKSPKIRHLRTIAQLRHLLTMRKNLWNSSISSTSPHNMLNFGPLMAEICWRVWGTPANFNGFRVLAALLHGTLVVGVSPILRSCTEGATYIRQGGHHDGHWPTFQLQILLLSVFRKIFFEIFQHFAEIGQRCRSTWRHRANHSQSSSHHKTNVIIQFRLSFWEWTLCWY